MATSPGRTERTIRTPFPAVAQDQLTSLGRIKASDADARVCHPERSEGPVVPAPMIAKGLLLLGVRLKTDSLQRGPDLRVLHEHLPDQTGSIVLDHHDHRRLVESHVDGGNPVLLLVECIAKAEGPPQLRALIPIEVLESAH